MRKVLFEGWIEANEVDDFEAGCQVEIRHTEKRVVDDYRIAGEPNSDSYGLPKRVYVVDADVFDEWVDEVLKDLKKNLK